jgi:ketosteroid isomerase-like protein
MSQENVEVVLQQAEALNREDVDAFVALVSPDVEWVDSVFWSEPEHIFRGRAEVREWFHQVVLEPWESFHVEVEEITEIADDRVFAGGLLTARGKGSGVETEVRGWAAFRIANGKITRREIFLDRDEALEAAGLSE